MVETSDRLTPEDQDLSHALQGLEERVARIEALLERRGVLPRSGDVRAPLPVAGHGADTIADVPPPFPDLVRWISFTGRLLIVLAGAYLLRAVTEGGQVPIPLGAAIGGLYAATWLVAAHRAALAGRQLSAAFHGLSAALVAFPLLYETSTRFGLLAPVPSALAVGVVALAGFALAARHGMQSFAWMVGVGGMACAVALLRPESAVPYAVMFVALGLVAMWIGRHRSWILLPWAAALFADGAVVYLTTVTLGHASTSPTAVLAIDLALLVLYMGSVAYSSLVHARPIMPFDVVQSVVVLAVAYRGALEVSEAFGTGRLLLGAVGVLAGLASYAVAFEVVERPRRRCFLYYSTLAIVLVVWGSAELLPKPALAWVLLSAAAAWLGTRFGRVVLSIHGVLYAGVATIASGAFTLAWAGWTARAGASPPPFTVEAALALLALALSAWMRVRTDNPYWGELALIPKFVAIVATAAVGGGILVTALEPALGFFGCSGDAAAICVLRTFVLSAAIVLCALAAGSERMHPASWLVYPLLALGPVKLLLQDLPTGRAATLFLSFLLYGSVLIAAPRILRSRKAAAGSR